MISKHLRVKILHSYGYMYTYSQMYSRVIEEFDTWGKHSKKQKDIWVISVVLYACSSSCMCTSSAHATCTCAYTHVCCSLWQASCNGSTGGLTRALGCLKTNQQHLGGGGGGGNSTMETEQ